MAVDVPATPPAAEPAPAVQAAPAAAGATFYVDAPEFRYSVTGNTLLPQARIEAILKSAATPKAAVDAMNNAYVDAGYLFVVIGGQVDNKLVALTVVQGRISEIEAPAELLPFLKNLRDRENLTRNQLIRDTAMVDFYEQRQGMSAKPSFAKGDVVGGTKLIVTEEPIPDAKPWSAGLAFSNLSGRFASRYTIGGSAALRPGNGFELTASYNQGLPGLTSESSGASYKSGTLGASLVTPWGLYGLTYGKTDYQIGESGAPFYPAGDIEQGGFTGTQIAWANATSRITTNQSIMRYSNLQTVIVEDKIFNLVEQDYTVLGAGAGYNTSFSAFRTNAALNSSVNVLKGITARDGTFLPADAGVPDPRFFLVQASATVQAALPYDTTGVLAVTGQYATSTLPQSQQWILGGFGNLTAWLPAVLVGDSGLLARATLTSSPYVWKGFSLSAGAFAEAGVARLHYRPDGEPTLRGLGDLGLTLTAASPLGTTLTMSYGFPVWYHNVEGAVRRSADSNTAHLYFTLNHAF